MQRAAHGAFSVLQFLAHRDCVDDGVDAMCPFCRMDVRDVLNGGLHVRIQGLSKGFKSGLNQRGLV